jgi:hypothetical protein
MLYSPFSVKLRIFWSVLLTFALSCTAFAEVYFLNNDDSTSSELNLLDEKFKAENEKAEEIGERKTGDNLFEFSGGDGEPDSIITNLNVSAQQNPLSASSCSYLYYPHINPYGLVSLCPSDYVETSRLLLYHKFIFYDLIFNLK